ncbi:hypothetical protein AB0H00_27555 [Nocardia sp. NPDC023852]|uniref:hypothetical protein n=1 Tax=Nocardia sp. NPDC023852 TaxID=3154697 RepID=UPI0033DE51B2
MGPPVQLGAVAQGLCDALQSRVAAARDQCPMELAVMFRPFLVDRLAVRVHGRGSIQDVAGRQDTRFPALHDTHWQAAHWYRRTQHTRVRLPIHRDLLDDDPEGQPRARVRDPPLSFDRVRREYGWRTVVEDFTQEVAVASHWIKEGTSTW